MDYRDEVNVTLFNEFGQAFEDALKAFSEQQVVIVLAGAKVNKQECMYFIINTYLKHFVLINYIHSI